jgi:hypothetical protein
MTSDATPPDDDNAQLVEYLKQRGHSDEEVAKILARIAEYDKDTVRQSVFDSIDQGQFDLDAIIKEALEK